VPSSSEEPKGNADGSKAPLPVPILEDDDEAKAEEMSYKALKMVLYPVQQEHGKTPSPSPPHHDIEDPEEGRPLIDNAD
jgi:hypothetical protein